jgi:hypothetical protein
MGYYSEVAMAFTKEGHERFNVLLTAEVLKGEKNYDGETPFDLLKWAEKTEYPNDTILYHWPDVKWYHNFPSVAAIMRAFEELEEKHYRYARCGEEYGDSEELGDMQGPPYLGFSSTLDVWD